MRHFSKEEWYFNGYTWCGLDKNANYWYPFSYDDYGTAYRMTLNINDCLNHMTIKRAKDQIKSEIKKSPFFKYRYEKIYIVNIKEYPTFYFDYLTIARKHRININHLHNQDEIVSRLEKYGFTPISDNQKIIEISKEEINLDNL